MTTKSIEAVFLTEDKVCEECGGTGEIDLGSDDGYQWNGLQVCICMKEVENQRKVEELSEPNQD